MLHFNKLDYFAIPNLPSGWEAPTWLTIELGLFAGRLYFEYDEYDDICRYLASHEVSRTEDNNCEAMRSPVDLNLVEGGGAPPFQSFTSKPLTFLQEWLSLKRKGQDFVHTPMGYICQAKSLTPTHPFFGRAEEEEEEDDAKEEHTNGYNSPEVERPEYVED